MKLRFFITEYQDGTLEIETKHMHYAFRDDLNFDCFPPEELAENMRKIVDQCQKENIFPYFEYVS